MRVLFLSQIVPFPPHGGVLQRGYHLLRHVGQEAKVHLLAFVHPDVLATPTLLEEARRELRMFCSEVEFFRLWPKASSVHRVVALAAGSWSREPFSVVAHRSSPLRQRVSELLRDTAFDVVHVDTIALSPFVEDVSDVPIVLTHHNIESELMERRARLEERLIARHYLRREVRKLRAYEREAAPRFDVNIVVSAADEAKLQSALPGLRTAVVPNGVDTVYFSPERSRETPALVYVGGMNMLANRDAVLFFLKDVWPLLVARAPQLRFFAVGQDPPRELLEFAAQDSRVVVTGYVQDIRPFVWQACVYVVPLRVGGGTRLKVLDAMAMGKAIVSTSVGCEGLEVENDQHLRVADGPEALAQTTLDLLERPSARERLGRAARALVEGRYAWQHVGSALMDTYREAIALRRRS